MAKQPLDFKVGDKVYVLRSNAIWDSGWQIRSETKKHFIIGKNKKSKQIKLRNARFYLRYESGPLPKTPNVLEAVQIGNLPILAKAIEKSQRCNSPQKMDSSFFKSHKNFYFDNNENREFCENDDKLKKENFKQKIDDENKEIINDENNEKNNEIDEKIKVENNIENFDFDKENFNNDFLNGKNENIPKNSADKLFDENMLFDEKSSFDENIMDKKTLNNKNDNSEKEKLNGKFKDENEASVDILDDIFDDPFKDLISKNLNLAPLKTNIEIDSKLPEQKSTKLEKSEKLPISPLSSKPLKMRPLHLATRKSNVEAAQLLIINGADVNALDNQGYNCLHLACLNRDPKMVKFFVESEIDLNDKSKSGKTALHYAVESGNREIVNLLINKNCKIDIKDNKNRTAVDVAKFIKEKEIYEILTQSKLNDKNKQKSEKSENDQDKTNDFFENEINEKNAKKAKEKFEKTNDNFESQSPLIKNLYLSNIPKVDSIENKIDLDKILDPLNDLTDQNQSNQNKNDEKTEKVETAEKSGKEENIRTSEIEEKNNQKVDKKESLKNKKIEKNEKNETPNEESDESNSILLGYDDNVYPLNPNQNQVQNSQSNSRGIIRNKTVFETALRLSKPTVFKSSAPKYDSKPFYTSKTPDPKIAKKYNNSINSNDYGGREILGQNLQRNKNNKTNKNIKKSKNFKKSQYFTGATDSKETFRSKHKNHKQRQSFSSSSSTLSFASSYSSDSSDTQVYRRSKHKKHRKHKKKHHRRRKHYSSETSSYDYDSSSPSRSYRRIKHSRHSQRSRDWDLTELELDHKLKMYYEMRRINQMGQMGIGDRFGGRNRRFGANRILRREPHMEMLDRPQSWTPWPAAKREAFGGALMRDRPPLRKPASASYYVSKGFGNGYHKDRYAGNGGNMGNIGNVGNRPIVGSKYKAHDVSVLGNTNQPGPSLNPEPPNLVRERVQKNTILEGIDEQIRSLKINEASQKGKNDVIISKDEKTTNKKDLKDESKKEDDFNDKKQNNENGK